MSELIDRQAALDALDKRFDNIPMEQTAEILMLRKDLRELPTIQPEERTEERTETHGVCLDAISRQEAIDAIDKKIKQCCKALGSLSLSDVDKHAVEVKMASLRAYRKMLESLPTAQPEPQWIPVSERLPRDGTWNIFTDGKNISVERYKADAIDHFFPNGRWFQLEDATAWMPLPEAYKGERT